VAVGAPFKGSWIMDLDQGIREVPGVGSRVEKGLATAFSFYVKKAGLMSGDRSLSSGSPAAQQVLSSSVFLRDLNDPSKAPKDLSVYSLYGDVSLTLSQKIFKSSVKKKLSVGDGVILPESATYLPGISPNLIAFSESAVSDAVLSKNVDASFSIEMPKLESITLFHNTMLSHREVKDKILSILTSD